MYRDSADEEQDIYVHRPRWGGNRLASLRFGCYQCGDYGYFEVLDMIARGHFCDILNQTL